MSDQAAPKKRPASQYYWGDWWKDKGLHSCSLTARGLWHEMNCLMHDGEPYGHLTLNGNPMTVAQLANQCRISPAQCSKLLKELDAAGVPSRTQEGVIFSRRMVRDELARNARAEGGKAGAEHGIKGAEHGSKGGRPTGVKGGSETPLDGSNKPPPSSSSSSSASAVVPDEPDGSSSSAEADLAGPAGEGTGKAAKDRLPPCPYEQVVELYHAALPELPGVRVLDDDRRKAIRGLWTFALTNRRPDGSHRATGAASAIAWVREFFETASRNDFVMGREGRTGEHKNWRATLEYLCSAKGIKRVIEQTEVPA